MPTALHSHESIKHYTPQSVVSRARVVFGDKIDLDPASDAFGNHLIKAEKFYTEADDGLNQVWSGNILCNPPGLSNGNRGGASMWWRKAMNEYARSWQRAVSCNIIFVGFSLELLQTCQSHADIDHPLNYTYCIPKQRLKFDVNANELFESLTAKLLCEMPDLKRARLEAKLTEVEQYINEAEAASPNESEFLRFPGDSPTHGNIIVCVTGNPEIRRQFRYRFGALGYVGGGY